MPNIAIIKIGHNRHFLCLVIVVWFLGTCLCAVATDWPSWRGPLSNGVSYESNLPNSGRQILWRIPYGGRSTPVISNGHVYGINKAGQGVMEQERIFSVDLQSGKLLWEHRFNVFHTDIPNSRVGWANPVVDPDTGYVYAHGVEGMFFCFSRDGRVLWSRSLTETLGRVSGYGGRTHTPVIDEERVVISFVNSSFGPQGRGGHRYLAMNKRTGDILWWSEPGGKPLDTTYSTPIVGNFNGQRLLIAGNADGGIYAIQARTGKPVWGFQLSLRGINSSIVANDNLVYACHSEENHDSTAMGRVVCINTAGQGDITKTHEVWRQDDIPAGYASLALHNGKLYAASNFGVLYCYDAKTGKEFWQHKYGRIGKGSPVIADGKIYIAGVSGRFVIIEDMGDKARTLDVMELESNEGESAALFGSPAISNGRIVFFTTQELICLGRKNASRQEVTLPSQAKESAPDSDAEPATLQIRPAEVLIKPGDKINFKALTYDAKGHFLEDIEAQWSYDGQFGKINEKGTFRTMTNAGSIGTVKAVANGLTAMVRVRIVPDLPIREDFESYNEGGMISWWIGVSKAKHAITVRNGSRVLKKIADDRGPIFNRSRVYITPPLKTGYTVEADILGEKIGRRRGDAGLINSRYRLEIYGMVPRLRVMSWVPGPRFEKRISFTWEPDRWYRVKFRVDLENGKAYPRVKIWPREENEPAQWTLEAEDPQPNLEGSAGIYAYSMTPIYFDNVHIYR